MGACPETRKSNFLSIMYLFKLELAFVRCVVVGVTALMVTSTHAEFENRSSVLDSSGQRSSGGSFTNVSAAGQPGGIAISTSGAIINQAGFLNTLLLRPDLDTDADGLVDELDPDNDNDTLSDADEIGGGLFSPGTPTLVNVADSDGDDVHDGAEAFAGTDPTDPESLFAWVSMSNGPSGRVVQWRARGNNERIYVVRAAAPPQDAYALVLFSNTISGGSAPWFAVTSSIAHVSVSNIQFYAVEARH